MLVFNAILCLALLGAPVQEKQAEAQPAAETKRLVDFTYADRLPTGQLVVSCQPARGCPPIPASSQLIDPETGEVLAMFADKDVGMGLAKVCPKGERLAFVSRGDLHIWPLSAGLDGADETVRKLRADSEVVLDLAQSDKWGGTAFEWTHDGQFLVTWAEQFFQKTPTGKVQIWKSSGELMWTGPLVAEASVHPTLNQFCGVVAGKVLVGWPVNEEGKPIANGVRTIPLKGATDTIQYSPNGNSIAVGGTGEIGGAEAKKRQGHAYGPRLWLLDTESGDVQVTKGLEKLDWTETKMYLSDVCWSPDGSMIGVSVGKGHLVAVVSSKDGSVIWRGGFQGGRMHEIFNTAWTDTGIMHTGWGTTRLVDPKNPDNPVTLERVARANLLNLTGTDDILLLYGWKIARLDPRTGEVRWTL